MTVKRRPDSRKRILKALEGGSKSARELAQATGMHVHAVGNCLYKLRSPAVALVHVCAWTTRPGTSIPEPIYALGNLVDTPKPSSPQGKIKDCLTICGALQISEIAAVTRLAESTVRAQMRKASGWAYIAAWKVNQVHDADGQYVAQWALGDKFDAPRPDSKPRRKSAHLEITPRQKEVLRHIAMGKLYKQVAADLFLSLRTVENHVKDMTRANGCNLNRLLVLSERAGHLRGVH